MADNSSIEWTDATWHVKTAAKRVGVTPEEYLALRRAGLKYCWRCRSWRLVVEFTKDRSRYDGLAAACNGCRRAAPRQLSLIRETPAEYARRRYATDPTHRAERRQHAHARARGVAPLPIEGIEALTEKFGGLCAYCPEPATTWDHIVPVVDGGRTEPGNILPACSSCNSRKKAMDVREFIARYGVIVSSALENELALAFEWGQLE